MTRHSPLKIDPLHGDLYPHQIHASFSLRKCIYQMAPRLVQPFFKGLTTAKGAAAIPTAAIVRVRVQDWG